MASRIKRTVKLLDRLDVAALHPALAAAGVSIADDERKGSRFGLSTRDALRRFQHRAICRRRASSTRPRRWP